MSLRFRLTVLVAVLMSLLIALALGVRYVTASADAIAEARLNLRLAHQVLPALLEPDRAFDEGKATIRRLADLRHVRVELLTADGTVVAASRPEPAQAPAAGLLSLFGQEWPQPLVRDYYVYGLRIASIRIVPDARDELLGQQRDMRRDVLLIGLIATVLALLVFLTVSRALGPIERIHRSLLAAREAGRRNSDSASTIPTTAAVPAASFRRMTTDLEGAMLERQNLIDQLQSAEAQTRRMIARDVHDELAPHLVAVRPLLAILEAAARNDHALQRYGDTLSTVREQVDATVTRIRALLEWLHANDPARTHATADTAGESLESALEQVVRRANGQVRPITVELQCEALPPLRPAATREICRIIQESIINASKHSDCEAVAIRLITECRDGFKVLAIKVRNGGHACDQGFGGTGIGLTGLRERAQGLGGTAETGPLSPLGGWQVCVRLPLERISSDDEPPPPSRSAAPGDSRAAATTRHPGRPLRPGTDHLNAPA